jgi:hypothetical protein
MKKTHAFVFCFVFILTSISLKSCGQNPIFKSAPKDKKESAEQLMEEKKYTEAQVELEALLVEDPNLYESRSLLAACLAAQGGVSLVDLILKAATEKSSTSKATSNSAVKSANPLANILPSATLSNIAFLRKANAQMALIPLAKLTESMKTQASAFLLFETLLFLDYLTKNPAALSTLSEADALKVVQNVALSASVLGSGAASKNPFATLALEKSKTLQSAAGSSSKEKLSTLLEKQSAG